MGKRGGRTLEGAAAAFQQQHHTSARPRSQSAERQECRGRSWLYQHFHHRNGNTDVYYCNHCCSGKAGSVDVDAGVIRLRSAALNPLARHVEKHGVTKGGEGGGGATASTDQRIERYVRHPKAKNEALLDCFADQMLIRDLSEFSLCEHPGFRAFCAKLDPRFKLCSRKKMTLKVLERNLQQSEALLMEMLNQALSDKACVMHYCGDLWTAEFTGQVHVAHCLQWVTSAFQMRTVCVSLAPFDSEKTADKQRENIDEVVQDVDIPVNQLGCLTTDAECALGKAADDYCEQNRRGRREYVGVRVPCGAHQLQLPPKHQLLKQHDPSKKQKHHADNHVFQLVRDCRNTVRMFNQSTKQSKVLAALSQELAEPECKLVMDQETRWNSTLHMLTSVWKRRRSVCQYSLQHAGKVPQWDDRRMLEMRDMIGVLTPLAEGTDIIQGARYATASYYLPTLHAILQSLHPDTPVYVCAHSTDEVAVPHTDLMPSAKTLRERLREEYLHYEQELSSSAKDVLIAAAMMDPKFKNVEWLPKCTSQESKKARNASFNVRLCKIYRQLFNEPPTNSRVEQPLPLPRQEDLKRRRSFYNRFQQLPEEPKPAEEAKSTASAAPAPVPETSTEAVEKAWLDFKKDLTTQTYTYLLCSPPSDEVEPLEFWQKFGMSQFPLLVVPARYLLSVFASQATAERIFSVSGARHRLGSGNISPSLLARLVQAHVNYDSVAEVKANAAVQQGPRELQSPSSASKRPKAEAKATVVDDD